MRVYAFLAVTAAAGLIAIAYANRSEVPVTGSRAPKTAPFREVVVTAAPDSAGQAMAEIREQLAASPSPARDEAPETRLLADLPKGEPRILTEAPAGAPGLVPGAAPR